jgi:succinyl-CoA synthetase beta subunit
LLPCDDTTPDLIPEAAAKQVLSGFDLIVPRAARCTSPEDVADAAADIGFPVVLKGEGIAHKTEAGAVILNILSAEAAKQAARDMPAKSYLVEQMITGTVAELLIGVTRDAAHGYVLTLGAGGTLTELMQDSASLLIPATRKDIEHSLSALRVMPLLAGYRGQPAAYLPAILDAIEAVQNYVLAHADGLSEIEINPLICTTTQAIAADALLRRAD